MSVNQYLLTRFYWCQLCFWYLEAPENHPAGGTSRVEPIWAHVGDQVLQIVSNRINAVIRSNDVAARLGGDEFSVIMNAVANGGTAERICRNIRAEIIKPMLVEGIEHEVGASFGFAIYPDDTKDIKSLSACADKAMYQAKQSHTGVIAYNKL